MNRAGHHIFGYACLIACWAAWETGAQADGLKLALPPARLDAVLSQLGEQHGLQYVLNGAPDRVEEVFLKVESLKEAIEPIAALYGVRAVEIDGIWLIDAVPPNETPAEAFISALPAELGEAVRALTPGPTLFNAERNTLDHLATMLARAGELPNDGRTFAYSWELNPLRSPELRDLMTVEMASGVALFAWPTVAVEDTAELHLDGRTRLVRLTGGGLQQPEVAAAATPAVLEILESLRGFRFPQLWATWYPLRHSRRAQPPSLLNIPLTINGSYTLGELCQQLSEQLGVAVVADPAAEAIRLMLRLENAPLWIVLDMVAASCGVFWGPLRDAEQYEIGPAIQPVQNRVFRALDPKSRLFWMAQHPLSSFFVWPNLSPEHRAELERGAGLRLGDLAPTERRAISWEREFASALREQSASRVADWWLRTDTVRGVLYWSGPASWWLGTVREGFQYIAYRSQVSKEEYQSLLERREAANSLELAIGRKALTWLRGERGAARPSSLSEYGTRDHVGPRHQFAGKPLDGMLLAGPPAPPGDKLP